MRQKQLEHLRAIRTAIASLPGDVSNDAIGAHAPTLAELYAPELHAAALDPTAPIVLGARGAGKSFWSGVLGDDDLRIAAAKAYPRLGLDDLHVRFGYTGLGGPFGINKEKLDQCVPLTASMEDARAFFWATILRATDQRSTPPKLPELMATAHDPDAREAKLEAASNSLSKQGKTLLIVYDALDTVAVSWPRRRLLTQALLEVAWAMRAYRSIRVKLFLRPDQLDDDGLRYVELPKLRSGAIRLKWLGTDLYGLLFARLAMGPAATEFRAALKALRISPASPEDILTRRWALGYDSELQTKVMTLLAGPYMADGHHGYKKGNTYDWPLRHLSDAFDEVTPRSFLGLAIAAAKYTATPTDLVFTPAGIKHGLRAASKTRVDQLHDEFPWIKGVLAPMAGLLLPQTEQAVYGVWKKAGTLKEAIADAERQGYLPPAVPREGQKPHEADLYDALARIGVMMTRADGRLDMPDLFRVAARLLKRGGTAPT